MYTVSKTNTNVACYNFGIYRPILIILAEVTLTEQAMKWWFISPAYLTNALPGEIWTPEIAFSLKRCILLYHQRHKTYSNALKLLLAYCWTTLHSQSNRLHTSNWNLGGRIAWTDWMLTLKFCVWVVHDRSLQGIEGLLPHTHCLPSQSKSVVDNSVNASCYQTWCAWQFCLSATQHMVHRMQLSNLSP